MSEKHKIRARRSKHRPAWVKLDNTALLFPAIASREMSNVYRIAVTLKEDIDGEMLQKAQDMVLPQFLAFRMNLKTGIFWYYLEENDRKPPKVVEENSYPGAYINKSQNNHYLFRVTYYKKRINLEVFHALTDGYGGLLFLKELVYQYLRLSHPDELKGEKDRLSPGLVLDMEDSYVKNFKSAQSRKEAYRSRKSVIIKGEHLVRGEMGVIHGYLPLDQIKAASKKHNVTINQYLVGAFVYSIYKEYLKGATSDRPINLCVPVDLRGFYDSHTIKNFFAMVMARFQPEKEEYSFDEVLEIVASSLKEQITKENLDKILSYNVSNEQNIFLKPIPLFIKNIAIRSVYHSTVDATTATMTNIGDVKLREHNGTLIVTFTTRFSDVSIQKRFFRIISNDSVEVAIETNDYREDE